METSTKDIKDLKQLRKQLLQLQSASRVVNSSIASAMQRIDRALGAETKRSAPVSSNRKLTHEQLVQKFM